MNIQRLFINQIVLKQKGSLQERLLTFPYHIVQMLNLLQIKNQLSFCNIILIILKLIYAFQDQYIHFSLKSRVIIILPGQILSLYFNFVTNTQAIPELTTNLDDSLAMSPDLHFEPNLTIQNIHLANCSQDTICLLYTSPSPRDLP